ncbi:hypothetical protein EYM_07925 [Ignicoccus islandicus DSM 13165]|uniref:Glutamine amidotransferase type-2 domain-containing protein n=1 Tax=Ignicoccus islandicus DSM 13165 TaxID=940295 RepID=A0A0U2WPF1_9CREN|nr:hypothetical protein [Ignicoccus islandicus]ALU12833.1 hypothetical protein EYM_07925 [Ignicoccus islandicus DSM 13165]
MLLARNPTQDLINAMISAALHDPLGAKRWGSKKEPNHPDGWGFIVITNKNRYIEYRSPKPIWTDEPGIDLLNRYYSESTLLIHARKTSIEGTEEFTQNIQPVGISNVVWIGYNGTIDPKMLDAPDPLLRLMKKNVLADTAAVAWAVLEAYNEKPLVTAMNIKGWLEDNVPEGSGAVVFFVDAFGNAGYAWECKCDEPELSYYKSYIYERDSTKAVASSTVALKHGDPAWKEAPEYGVL